MKSIYKPDCCKKPEDHKDSFATKHYESKEAFLEWLAKTSRIDINDQALCVTKHNGRYYVELLCLPNKTEPKLIESECACIDGICR